MNNYMKTVVSGLKQWISAQKSDWNQNDSSAANFIKNRPFYSEEKEKVLFSGNIPVENFSDDVYGAEGLAYGLSFTIGQIYRITFDNVEYSCECFSLMGQAFGNASIVGEGADSGEPFFIGYNDNYGLCLFCLTEGTHSLSISGTVEEVHQIDKKYVPMPELADVAHTGDYYDLQNTPYIPWDIVRYGTTQSLTEGNRKIARNNIGAAAATDVSSLNTSVSNLNTSVSNLSTLVGDTAVSTQIENATDGCITRMSVSGKVITYTKGDGSTGTITTQDTNTTYSVATTSSPGLMSSYDKEKLNGVVTNIKNGDGTGSLHGNMSNAEGNYSSATGYATRAIGNYSHAEGYYTLAFGEGSHAEGRSGYPRSIKITGAANSFTYQVESLDYINLGSMVSYNNFYGFVNAIDENNNTITLDSTLSETDLSEVIVSYWSDGFASGRHSHAEGYETRASGDSSHAEGYLTKASGDYSHAEGAWTTASGPRSHAEGSNTTASGLYSHAEGYDTTASGHYSHAGGLSTIASSNCQQVHGKYNIIDDSTKYAYIVGNGTTLIDRSNAHTLDWNGVGWYKGGLKVGGTGQDDAAAVEVALKSDLASLSAPTAISLTRIDEICNQTIYSTNEVTF